MTADKEVKMIPASPWLLIHGPADGAANAAAGPIIARFHKDVVRSLLTWADRPADGVGAEADALLFGSLVQGDATVISVESVEGFESLPLTTHEGRPEPQVSPPEGIGLLKLALATSGLVITPRAVGCIRSKAGSKLVADSEDRCRYRMHFADGPGVLLLVRRNDTTTLDAACYLSDGGDIPLSVAARFSLCCVENPLPAMFVGTANRAPSTKR
jgi:hypothetical protein